MYVNQKWIYYTTIFIFYIYSSTYIVLKQGRGLIWPSLGQTQKVKLISQILGKVKTFMFHIYFKIHEWFCTLKTMNGRSLWINGLFSRPNGLTRCIFFHSFHSWKNMQLVSPFGLSKRQFIHMDQPFIVFFVQSFIFFIMNVEKEQFYTIIYKVKKDSTRVSDS